MRELDLTKYKFGKKYTILQFMSLLGVSALLITFALSYIL